MEWTKRRQDQQTRRLRRLQSIKIRQNSVLDRREMSGYMSKTRTTTLPLTSSSSLELLSLLLLSETDVSVKILKISKDQFEVMRRMACSHHVIMRAMKSLLRLVTMGGGQDH